MSSRRESFTVLIAGAGSVLLLLAVLLAGKFCLQFYGGRGDGWSADGGPDADRSVNPEAREPHAAPAPKGGLEVSVKDGQGLAVEKARIMLFSLGSSLYFEAESGGGGLALLEGLPPGDYSLAGSGGLLVSSSPQLVTVRAGEATAVTLVLVEGITLRGRVHASPGGLPAAGVCVSASSSWTMARVACGKTAQDGSFSLGPLAPGRYTLSAAMEGFSTERIHGLVIEAGKPAVAATLQIKKLAAVTGRIITAEGLPVPEASLSVNPVRPSGKKQLPSANSYQDIELPPPMKHPRLIPSGQLGIMKGPVPDFKDVPGGPAAPDAVSAAPPGEEGPCPCMKQAAEGGQTSSTASDASGSFTLRVDPDTEFDLVVFHSGYAPKKLTRLRPKDASCAPLEIILDMGKEIPGRLADLEGGPPAGAQLWMELPDFSLILDVPVDGDGSFFLTQAAGPIILHANAPGYAPERKKIDADLLEPGDMVELVLVPDRQLVWGRVLDWRGFPIGGVKVIVEAGAGGGGAGRTAVSDVDGVFSFVTLAPGPWKVTIDHPSYFTFKDALKGWEGEEEFTLVEPGGISGKVTDDRTYLPVGEFRLTLKSEENPPLTRDFDGGSYAWTDLPAGRAVLEIEAQGYATQSREVTIPSSEDKRETTLEDVDFWLIPVQ
jgi:hypothetical protein